MQEKNYSSSPGKSSPLGATAASDGVNFALYAPKARHASLGLFEEKGTAPFAKIPLKKTRDVWHIKIEQVPQNAFYAFEVENRWVLDPYAKELNATKVWGEQIAPLLGKVFPDKEFDWEGEKPLHLPLESLMIYEMHVRGFTQDGASRVQHPGTFLGVIEKIPYLSELGVNAIELLPIFAFDEALNPRTNPKTGEKLYNYWGYSTLNYFSPMAPFGSIREFKEMIKALHRAGIEVILDVVYNHVGTDFFSHIAKETYFILDQDEEQTNYTGCGNTVNCNHPVVIEFILSSLRYWVEEMHVDGFRFDLASIFCRDNNGDFLKHPPVIKAIEKCKALSHTKLIAEPWDCAGLYQVGSFPSKRFAEWNGKFRDSVRAFIKGTDAMASDFANAMLGSPDLYEDKKAPYQNINFITAHDGFTLYDLVSYNGKHNEENGEENRDGNDNNISWNCGEEGDTQNPEVLALRERQMRNLLLTLVCAIGTPMLLMGDEYGHTRGGNNNSYCQDNWMNYFLWDKAKQHEGRLQFFQYMLSFRKSTPLLQRKRYISGHDVIWHGHQPENIDWSSRFIAYTLKDRHTELYFAFNANHEGANITLPKPKHSPRSPWKRIVDTTFDKQERLPVEKEYFMHPNSSLLLML